ncbi:hypothetical protein DACRYDRAFT_105932 [Dacryopinax primogenitus]|uniref:Uncharacterized protein n=1 Tax=Dacryopinax primogenitus (strain DJM 731) TaxID=1858805 RepID=M5GCB3_DACPD|nr:uncharacterized protein DACRYDRAFT_105932 [Dacryopinax primogenitus]EJU03777.1 hypothetical protein DACRYDRAFT_105932 [Dacryopinax primogenitus]
MSMIVMVNESLTNVGQSKYMQKTASLIAENEGCKPRGFSRSVRILEGGMRAWKALLREDGLERGPYVIRARWQMDAELRVGSAADERETREWNPLGQLSSGTGTPSRHPEDLRLSNLPREVARMHYTPVMASPLTSSAISVNMNNVLLNKGVEKGTESALSVHVEVHNVIT